MTARPVCIGLIVPERASKPVGSLPARRPQLQVLEKEGVMKTRNVIVGIATGGWLAVSAVISPASAASDHRRFLAERHRQLTT